MKTYREVFDNLYYPDLKVMNYDEYLQKNANIVQNFAENSQKPDENTPKNDFFNQNLNNNFSIIPTNLRNVTPKKNIFQKLRGN